MAEAVALEVVVAHLADPLRPERHPGQVLAGAPAAGRPGQALRRGAGGRSGGAGLVAPGMAGEGVAAQRRQLLRRARGAGPS